MTERETDFEFDFFDEPETHETGDGGSGARPGRLPKRSGGPRGPLRPPTRATPLLRLVALVALAILAIVLLVFWVESCRGASKTRSYRDYVSDLTAVANQSAAVGRRLDRLLTTPGIKQGELRRRLNGLVQQEQQDLAQAGRLSPPGPLREAHQHAIEALQFRVSGLTGLSDAFGRRARPKNAERAGSLLAAQASRLVASDVVWDDRVKAPAKSVLAREGIGGVRVPDSNFVSNPDLVTARSFTVMWRGLSGAATGGTPTGGLRGTALASVTVQPADERLSTDAETVIRVSGDLAFQAAVENSGNVRLVGVVVTLTIENKRNPRTVKNQTIDVIDPGETKTVTFRDLGQPDFGGALMLTVRVKPVPGEARTTNNSASYTVIFSVA